MCNLVVVINDLQRFQHVTTFVSNTVVNVHELAACMGRQFATIELRSWNRLRDNPSLIWIGAVNLAPRSCNTSLRFSPVFALSQRWSKVAVQKSSFVRSSEPPGNKVGILLVSCTAIRFENVQLPSSADLGSCECEGPVVERRFQSPPAETFDRSPYEFPK